MQYPTIRIFKTDLNFRYFWGKYVNGFNLNVHCAKCLIGSYSKKIAPDKCIINAVLNEHECKYYYICGVTTPYVWRNNFHVAFVYSPNDILDYNDGHTHIIIENARQIQIIAQDYRDTKVYGNKSFTTCRNWQFAYQMTKQNERAELNTQ